MENYISYLIERNDVKILIIFIVFDTLFGILRAIKEKGLNSNIGIDGIIRKVGMIISIVFFYLIDFEANINMIGFIPKELLEVLPIKEVGIGILFNILFIVFEGLSILKNMIKCKLPIPKALQKFLENVLNSFTTELKGEKENGSKK